LHRRMAQPLIIAVASGAALWGLSRWTGGLGWGEVMLWDIALYTLAYITFSWVARYLKVIPVIVTTILIIVIVQIIASL